MGNEYNHAKRREGLIKSLKNPNPESAELAEQGMDEWARGLPDENAAELVDMSAGKAIR